MPTETSTVCVANSLPPYHESISTIDDRDAPCPLGQADSERLLTDRRSCESLIDEGSGGQGLTHTLSPFGGISARRATEQQASHAGKTLACSSCRAPPSSWMMALINYNDYRVWSSTKDATRVSNSKEQPAPLHSTARLDCQTGVKYYGWQAVCTGSQSLGHFCFLKAPLVLSPQRFHPRNDWSVFLPEMQMPTRHEWNMKREIKRDPRRMCALENLQLIFLSFCYLAVSKDEEEVRAESLCIRDGAKRGN